MITPIAPSGTNTAQFEELIARLEKLSGPDREADLAILNTISQKGTWFFHDKHRLVVICDEFGPGAPGNSVCSLEDFTGSIDAARTLILPEYSFGGLSQISPRDWIMLIFSRTDSHARWEGEASTAEAAICIAALRARSAA